MKIADAMDGVISFFSPTWGLERIAKRNALKILKRGYEGGKIRDNDRYFLPTNKDADSQILRHMARLNARARYLVRNNPEAARIVSAYVLNVVGSTGLKLQVQSGDDKENTRIERIINENLENIDFAGLLDFCGMQRLAERQLVEVGEAFFRITYDNRTRPNFIKLQALEPDQIYTTASYNGKNPIIGGIEVHHKTGAHVAYYVNEHPGGYASTYKSRESEQRVLASDMIHIYRIDRPGQTRGVTRLAPVVERLSDMGSYVEAHLQSARVEACLAVLIKQNLTGEIPTDPNDNPIKSLAPGMIEYMRPGEEAQIIDPKRPGKQIDMFTNLLQRSISAGVDLATETVSNNYAGINYSSGKLSRLTEDVAIECDQSLLKRMLCNRVVKEIIDLQTLRGKFRKKFTIDWIYPKKEWTDPEREIASAVIAIENNLETKKGIIARRGKDYEDVLKQRAIEKELEKKYGIENASKPNEPAITNEGKVKPQ